MSTTPRNIRFDDDLYGRMMALTRPDNGSFHIQEACHQYLERMDKPVVKVKEVAAPADDSGYDLFDGTWEAYGKKGNKKTSRTKFNRLNKMDRQLLVDSIPAYVESTPDKQYRKNFETYINQECWNDEVITDGNQNRFNGNSGANQQSAVDSVRATNAANRAARANNRGDLADSGGHLRELTGETIRQGDAPSMDNVIDGDYSETN